jgi:hypothetical protein
MIWHSIIMAVLFNISGPRAEMLYQATGFIHYQMEAGYCIDYEPGDVPIPGTPHYEALIGIGEYDQGSGMGLRPHMWLGPNNIDSISPPAVNPPHKPPSNDGEAGGPIVVVPDDPDPDPVPEPGTYGDCSTIGDVDDYYFDVSEYLIDAIGTERTGSGSTTATMTSGRHAKFVIVKDMLKRGILTTNYKNDILSESYCNTSMTTAQVWARICSGRENWRPVEDNGVDAVQSVYYTTAGVVGFVSSVSASRIWSNVRVIDGYDPSTLAGHVQHEWTHLLGFGHGGGSASCGNEGDVSYEAGAFFGNNMESLDGDYGW